MTTRFSPQRQPDKHIHIDRMRVIGRCRHKPLGPVLYLADDTFGYVPAGSCSPSKRNGDDEYIKSKGIGDDGYANELEIYVCPPKVLQRHNVFGHSSLPDYCYAVFDKITRQYGIKVDPQDRGDWRNGRVWLTEVHLTGNFACPSQDIVAIIDAIDENTPEGKWRSLQTAIGIGYVGQRRSKYHVLSLYGKLAQLQSEWRRFGLYQSKIMNWVKDSIRGEIKIFSSELKHRNLQWVSSWRDVDTAALFFEIFERYNVNYAIQPVLTEDEIAVLTSAERRVYLLWQSGISLWDQFRSRSSVSKYTNSILSKVNVDVSQARHPESLPKVHLADIFCMDGLLPIPDWAHGTPCYFPPGPSKRRGSGIGNVAVPPGQKDELIVLNGQPFVI
ncbi:MAG: hypothetical protein IPL29_09750 [Propionivibrio sp.]|nr:hypothetical protein [Propionivibrio sp.]